MGPYLPLCTPRVYTRRERHLIPPFTLRPRYAPQIDQLRSTKSYATDAKQPLESTAGSPSFAPRRSTTPKWKKTQKLNNQAKSQPTKASSLAASHAFSTAGKISRPVLPMLNFRLQLQLTATSTWPTQVGTNKRNIHSPKQPSRFPKPPLPLNYRLLLSDQLRA